MPESSIITFVAILGLLCFCMCSSSILSLFTSSDTTATTEASVPTRGESSNQAPIITPVSAKSTTPATDSCSGTNKCSGTAFQEGWKNCTKCYQIYFSAVSSNCAAGGLHMPALKNYKIPTAAITADATQTGWKWCKKCSTLSFTAMNGKCYDKKAHDYSGSGEYFLCTKMNHPECNWKWCNKCCGICLGNGGRCQDGFPHDFTGSSNYQIPVA